MEESNRIYYKRETEPAGKVGYIQKPRNKKEQYQMFIDYKGDGSFTKLGQRKTLYFTKKAMYDLGFREVKTQEEAEHEQQ